MRLLPAFVLLLACAAANAAPPVYRCETAGRVNYSDSPCVGGAVVDIAPTQGMDRMSGASRKGHDVQRTERNKGFDEVIRPLSGKTHDEMNTLRRRVKLPARDQAVCSQLDEQLADLEAATKQPTASTHRARADVDLYLARKRYFDLKC